MVLERLLPYFGPDRRMATINGADIDAHRADRMTEQKTEEKPENEPKKTAALASTNRELANLRRAFRIARKRGVLMAIPHIETPKENDVRTGFCEQDQFEAVREALPEAIRAVATFCYLTGRGRTEVLTLKWSNVDRDRQVITLDVGGTKNNEGRVLPYDLLPELVEVIDTAIGQNTRRYSKPRRSARSCSIGMEGDPRVPHRVGERTDGSEVWAQTPARLPADGSAQFHPCRCAGKGSDGGHRSPHTHVFDRYNIMTDDDVRNAHGALATAKPGTPPRNGQVHGFKARKTA